MAQHRCFRLDCPLCLKADQVAIARREKRAKKFGCRCGSPNCDCARWERIYRQKFEDPTYYEPRLTRVSSPLSQS